jgi:hypothetical protein
MDTPFLVSPPQPAMGGTSINQTPREDVNHCPLHGSTAASATSYDLVDPNKMPFEEDFPNYSFEDCLPGVEVAFQGLLLSRICGAAFLAPHGFSPHGK